MIIYFKNFEEGPLHQDDVTSEIIDSSPVKKSKNLVKDAFIENFDHQSQWSLVDIDKEEFVCNDGDGSDIDPMFLLNARIFLFYPHCYNNPTVSEEIEVGEMELCMQWWRW